MALWNVNDEIVYSENALTLSPNEVNGTIISRHFYKVPISNVRGGFLTTNKGVFHTPSWTKVHPKTTLNDILFPEIKVAEPKEKRTFEFASSSSDKKYYVTVIDSKTIKCTCPGSWRSQGNCKHIKEVRESLTK
tara:strand:- start:423 stop:824 length:402 start_codon:yes stop_codon:yes gene_type:complete